MKNHLNLLSLLFLVGCAAPTPITVPTSVEPAVLVGAGDISLPGNENDVQTAILMEGVLERYPQAVIFADGDNTQGEGTSAEYAQNFDSSWGRFKSILHPVPGNHDFLVDRGVPYYDYFGKAAGERGQGYYSYDLGEWHIVALNSNCDMVDCSPESVQAKWLREDLAASRKAGNRCTLLYWHHPHWSRDAQNGDSKAATFWSIASEFRTEVVVNGHHHIYVRMKPQDAGYKESPTGIRVFVAGTGGAGLHEIGDLYPNTEVVDNATYGVLQFKLYPGVYEWEFIPISGSPFTDSGIGSCH